MCNSRLWLNVETGDVSTNARPGYQNGCGCLLRNKTRLVNAHCPVDNGKNGVHKYLLIIKLKVLEDMIL